MKRSATKTEQQLDEMDRWSLLTYRMRVARMPLWAMEELVRAFEHGVEKHGAGDYLRIVGRDRVMREIFMAKAGRHIDACHRYMAVAGEILDWMQVDEESGVSHMAKAAANLLIGLEVEKVWRDGH